jgi:hypothetical protein
VGTIFCKSIKSLIGLIPGEKLNVSILQRAADVRCLTKIEVKLANAPCQVSLNDTIESSRRAGFELLKAGALYPLGLPKVAYFPIVY